MITENQQIHPEAAELEIESQYSSRLSQVNAAPDGGDTDRHANNITEGNMHSVQENLTQDDVEHGIDLGQQYLKKQKSKGRREPQYIDFNTINDVSIDTDEQVD